MLKRLCPRCGFANESDWNFCQICRSPIGQIAPAQAASSFTFPKLTRKQIGIISIVGILGLVVVVAVGVWALESQRKREAALAASYNELVQAAHARLADGDISGAQAALAEARQFRSANTSSMKRIPVGPAEAMEAECKAVPASDALHTMVASMSDTEFKLYQKDGTLPAKPYYKTPEVDLYARKLLSDSKEKAVLIRRDIEIAKRDAEKAAAARQKEAEIAAKRESLRKEPLEVVASRWETGGFGTVGVWRVTFRNKSDFRVGNIAYETVYFAETGAQVGSGDGLLQKVIEPRATRTIEINDGFISNEAHRARFTLVSAEVLN